jgi:pimeloyl-ACP methyl ester carboxylesterase
LMISGSEDHVNPIETNAALLKKAMPKARLEIIKGIGHLPQVEAPDDVNRLLRAFVPK